MHSRAHAAPSDRDSMSSVRTFTGKRPSRALAEQLADQESCLARFLMDPLGRVWVCARLGIHIYSAPLDCAQTRLVNAVP